MIQPQSDMSRFEFAVRASLRAKQLMQGSVPKIAGDRKRTTTALLEVAAGLIDGTVEAVDWRAGSQAAERASATTPRAQAPDPRPAPAPEPPPSLPSEPAPAPTPAPPPHPSPGSNPRGLAMSGPSSGSSADRSR